MSKEDTQAYLKLWSVSFKDYEYLSVANAVNAIIQTDTREFAPNIAVVKKQITRPLVSSAKDAGEAWEQVIRNCTCSQEKANRNYKRLPRNIQRALGGSFMLIDVGYSTSATIGFLRDKFMKRYESVIETEVAALTAGSITAEQFIEHDIKAGEEKQAGLQKMDFKSLTYQQGSNE